MTEPDPQRYAAAVIRSVAAALRDRNPDSVPNGTVLEHPDYEAWWLKLADGTWLTDNDDWPSPYDSDGNPLVGCHIIAIAVTALHGVDQ